MATDATATSARRWPRLTLRARLTLSVMLLALLSTLGVATGAFFYIKSNTLEEIASDQMRRTEAIADAIDQKFISRRVVLKAFAESLEALQLRGTAQLQPFLLRHTALLDVFDNVTVLDRQGDLVANYLGLEALGKLNLADRPYFIETLASDAGVISPPIRNRSRGLAQVLMTQPVHDAQGRIAYVINGQITLEKPNFLGDIADLKFGKTGYVFITNTDGIVIHSPRKSRILQHFNAEGGYNEATSRAVAGFEGTTDAINRLGVHALYAFKQTRQTNWIVGTHYPYEEAVADLHRVERWTALGAVALSLLVGGLSLLLLRRQLAPLGRLHRHIVATQAATHYQRLEAEHPDDELGDLARSFDHLMAERHAARQQLEASENYLRDVLEHAGDAFVAIDGQARITEWNHQAELIFGHTREQALGQSLSELMVPATMHSRCLAGMAAFFRSGTGPLVGRRTELNALHRDGRLIPVELSVAAMDQGDHFVAHAFLRDISERRAAQERVAASRKLLQDITDTLPALVAHLDTNERFGFVNSAVREWWSQEPEHMIGRTMREVVGDVFYARIEPMLKKALAGERVEFESERMVNGVPRDAHSIYVPERDEHGAVVGVVVMTTNITDLKTAQRTLAQQARVDPLTLLANRVAFNETLPLMLARARRSGDALAVMYLDIDHFKAINDSLGHAAGDEVLCEFARRLQASVRATDLAVRLAGDEFVVVLENLCGTEVAGAVAQKIVDQVARPVFDVHGRPLSITTSIGIAFHAASSPPATPAELLARADGALYAAKAAGRNRFEFAV
ncbi:MAG: diguanylate cyclase [Burkholderiaceae bacterium]|nr:diguanylate cyclase [Burkholderiaceae bacterium]